MSPGHSFRLASATQSSYVFPEYKETCPRILSRLFRQKHVYNTAEDVCSRRFRARRRRPNVCASRARPGTRGSTSR